MSTESTSTKHHGSYESSNATALGSGSQEYSRNSSRGATASSERVKASWEDSQSSRAEGEDDILNGIPAKGDKGFNLSDFCFELDRSSRAERAVVTSIRRYATKGRVKHRFLLISVNLEADKFWFRLDRHPRTKSFLKLSSASYLASNDLVKLALSLNVILKDKEQQEALINFEKPVPLRRLAKALGVIRDESVSYGLSKENCWFFASIIQEISLQFLGGYFSAGGRLNHPRLARGRRTAIKARLYKVLPTPISASIADTQSIAEITHDDPLISAFSSLLCVVGGQDELLHCSQAVDVGLERRMEEILQDCKCILYEHLRGLSGISGARNLGKAFPSELIALLGTWRGSLKRGLKEGGYILDISHLDALHERLEQLLVTAFDPMPQDIARSEPGSPCWTVQEPFSKIDLDLALRTLDLLALCEPLDSLSQKYRYQLNRDIVDLDTIIRSAIPREAWFACKSWALLATRVNCSNKRLLRALDSFIRNWLPHWIVAMGLMGEVDAACRSLHRAERWMRRCRDLDELRGIISHAYRFILRSKKALTQCSFFVFSGSPFQAGRDTRETPFDAVLVTSAGMSKHLWSRLHLNLRSNGGAPCSISYSPDGMYLASASREKCVQVWCAGTGTLLRRIKLPSVCVSVTFSPDGSQLACAAEDNRIYSCEALGKRELIRLSGHTGRVNSITFTPYGTRLASGSRDRTIRIWEVAEGKSSHVLLGHTDAVVSVTCSVDGTRLASASYDGSVRIWDAAIGSQLGIYRFNSPIYSVAFFPESVTVAFACGDHSVRIWDTDEGQPRILRGHTDVVYSVSCSPNGRLVASASADKSVCIWDAITGQKTSVLDGHLSKVYAVAFSPDGEHVASASRDCTIQVRDVHPPSQDGDIEDRFTIATSSDARIRASINNDKNIHITSADSPGQRILLEGHKDWITCASFSPDHLRLASASRDMTVRVWDVGTGNCLKQIPIQEVSVFRRDQSDPQAPFHISFSENGLFLRIRGCKILEEGEGLYSLVFRTDTWVEHSIGFDSASIFPETYSPDPSLPIVVKDTCLCVERDGALAYVCWLPDDFEAVSDVVQVGKRVSLGGKGGVLHVNFDGLGPIG